MWTIALFNTYSASALALTLAFMLAIQAGESVTTVSGKQSQLFVFKDGAGSEFIFKLTDPARIREANAILSGNETAKVHVSGRIKKWPATYNRAWNFHLVPEKIQFFELSIEVCDASIEYVSQNLDEVCGSFLPGCFWCPWSSIVIRKL